MDYSDAGTIIDDVRFLTTFFLDKSLTLILQRIFIITWYLLEYLEPSFTCQRYYVGEASTTRVPLDRTRPVSFLPFAIYIYPNSMPRPFSTYVVSDLLMSKPHLLAQSCHSGSILGRCGSVKVECIFKQTSFIQQMWSFPYVLIHSAYCCTGTY